MLFAVFGYIFHLWRINLYEEIEQCRLKVSNLVTNMLIVNRTGLIEFTLSNSVCTFLQWSQTMKMSVIVFMHHVAITGKSGILINSSCLCMFDFANVLCVENVNISNKAAYSAGTFSRICHLINIPVCSNIVELIHYSIIL